MEQEFFLSEGDGVVVGVSGGADSVALLHILHRLGFPVTAAHLNHAIRNAEADADEAFVKTLCKQLGVECITQKTDVPALAKEKRISLEMAARNARHAFFRTFGGAWIVLAHHADDQLETFFLRAARGTGLEGLGGMRACKKLAAMHLLRPMLGIRRTEILHWLKTEGLEWREDASNADESIPRNFVRHQILPGLGKMNDRAAENILRTMALLRDEADHPEKAARRREARDWLIEHGATPSFDAVEQLVELTRKKNGTQFLDLEGIRIANEYGKLRAVSENANPQRSVWMEEGVGILRGPWQASVAVEKVAGRNVSVRTPYPGDRMNPYGMNGSKKLQDILTDLKIPKAQRAEWPVVECGGEIIWLPGYRIARGWELAGKAQLALHLFCDSREPCG